MRYSVVSKLLLSTSLVGLTAATATAQDNTNLENEIIVVGTQIKGSDIAGILPVTVLDINDIEVTGAVSGDELFESIPQLGDVTFREANFTGVNGARGDVGSVNLRGVGDGNTLVLINGRRLVNHPGTQAVNQTPVVSVNSNALPVTGIKRLEILRDGASAVYGTDAVAGVINTILDDDYEGLQVTLQYGASGETSLDELSGTFKWGKNFNEGKTNFSVFGNALFRSGFPATDLRNSSTEDLRVFFDGTPFEGDTQLRNTSTQTQFGEFETLAGEPRIDGIGDDDFNIQPDTFDGCLFDLPGPVCARAGTAIDPALRLDRAGFRDLGSDLDRYNLFGFVNHEFDNGIDFFGEASYYRAETDRARETAAILSSNRIIIPESGFFNPFGQDIRITDYRPIDSGQRFISVDNESFRLVGGFRGQFSGWDWESALVHSESTTNDTTNRISNTLFQEALGRADATAYNPFAGGNVNDFSLPNFANNQATIDGFLVDVSRDGKTKLTLADAKLSNPAVFSLPAGDVGAAVGVEWRRETFEDDRDDRLDGTITFTDSVTGITNLSDVLGTSPTPDTDGSRNVYSAFAELAVPVVSSEMNIPLVHSFDVQLALRYEDYSDVGDKLRPKIAASWHLFEQFQLRGAYSKGFRAPNLEQINATDIRRVNTAREDWILCEAIQRADGDPAFTDDNDCDNFSIEGVRGGGPDLRPETSDNYSFGATFQPTNDLIFTVDYWRIEQNSLVGLFSDQNEISLDYLRRLQGSSNAAVVRDTPDEDIAAIFVAAGLDPSGAGEILEVRQDFRNLDQRTSAGIDFGALFKYDANQFGDFTFKGNVAYIDKFFQDPSAEGVELLAALDAGVINSLVDVVGQEDLIKQNGNPEVRYSGSVVWDKGPWGAGVFLRHVGDVVDTSTQDADGNDLPISSVNIVNVSADYTFDEFLGGDNTRIRLGVRNVGNRLPPIADEFARGYFTGLHSNRGRYFYGSIRHNF